MIKKPLNFSLKLTAALTVILAILNIVGSNLLATQGRELEKIQQKTLKLQDQNQVMTNKIARHSSLSYLEDQAEQQGFVKITQPLALKDVSPVAFAPNR